MEKERVEKECEKRIKYRESREERVERSASRERVRVEKRE